MAAKVFSRLPTLSLTKSIAMTEHLDELIEGCKRADISLDFILPLVSDKPQEYVTDDRYMSDLLND